MYKLYQEIIKNIREKAESQCAAIVTASQQPMDKEEIGSHINLSKRINRMIRTINFGILQNRRHQNSNLAESYHIYTLPKSKKKIGVHYNKLTDELSWDFIEENDFIRRINTDLSDKSIDYKITRNPAVPRIF